MNSELEAIIQKLQDAKEHVVELKANHNSDTEEAETVEDVELALEWAIKKLRRMNESPA